MKYARYSLSLNDVQRALKAKETDFLNGSKLSIKAEVFTLVRDKNTDQIGSLKGIDQEVDPITELPRVNVFIAKNQVTSEGTALKENLQLICQKTEEMLLWLRMAMTVHRFYAFQVRRLIKAEC